MRQFILAKQFVDNIDVADAAVGDLGLVYITGPVTDISTSSRGQDKHANFVLITKDGPILFPLYPKNLTGSVMRYAEGNAFTATFEIGEINPYLDYVVTFVKKGKQFNERNKWSAVIHSKASDTPETIAKAIVDFVNNNPLLGLIAENEEAVVTVTGKSIGEDYTITFGDELYGTQIYELTQAEPAQGNAAHVRDLFEKCAADRGFTYTGEDLELYPGYKVNIEEREYMIMTLRFTEPRVMGTREEEVYQIIQIAIPGEGYQMDELVDAINKMFDIEPFHKVQPV